LYQSGTKQSVHDYPNRTANRDLADYLDLAIRLANLLPALLDFETGEIGPDLWDESVGNPLRSRSRRRVWRSGRPRSIPKTGRPATRPRPAAWQVECRSTRPSTPVRRHEGLWVWIKLFGKVVERGSGSRPLRLALAVRNIDDLRQAEQQLVESERR
jgi:hypothetical protein